MLSCYLNTLKGFLFQDGLVVFFYFVLGWGFLFVCLLFFNDFQRQATPWHILKGLLNYFIPLPWSSSHGGSGLFSCYFPSPPMQHVPAPSPAIEMVSSFQSSPQNPLFTCPDLANIGLNQSNPHWIALKHNFCLMTLNGISRPSLFTSLNYKRKSPGFIVKETCGRTLSFSKVLQVTASLWDLVSAPIKWRLSCLPYR